MKKAIDLGLAIGASNVIRGDRRTYDQIAAFCNWNPVSKRWTDCSWQRIWQIEQRALRKLRDKLLFQKDPVLQEAVMSLLKR